MRISLVFSCLTLLLMTPVLGTERSDQRYGGYSQQTGGRVAAPPQTPTPTPAKAQTPPATSGQSGQGGQRQPPSAEQFLGWDWWKDDAVRKEMKLTDSQVRNITQIFNSRVQYIKPFYDEYSKQLAELDKMSQERTVEVSVFEMQVNRVESLRAKLNETRIVMLYRINRMLDPTQSQKLREIRDRRRSGRGGGSSTPRTW